MPSMETVEADFETQDKLVDILLLVQIIKQQISELDPRRLDDMLVEAFQPIMPAPEEALSLNELFRLLPANTKNKLEGQTIYLSYLIQLFSWTVISILSASYLSSLVLIRTVLELLINAASEDRGGLRNRVAGIAFLEEEERKEIIKNWDELCGWAHPYGRWFNEMCPVYVSRGPLYHNRLANLCTSKLQLCVDFALVVAVNRFAIDANRVAIACTNMHINTGSFPMLRSRTPRK